MPAELHQLEETIALTLRDYPTRERNQVYAFAATLRPDQLAAFWEVVIAVDWAGGDTRQDDLNRLLNRCLAHFPGLAPAFRVVYEHLDGDSIPPCAEGGDGKCTLPPLPDR